MIKPDEVPFLIAFQASLLVDAVLLA